MSGPVLRSQPTLTLAGAEILSHGARQKASSMGIDMNIAVVDSSTHLLHFSRMPSAKITSIPIAINKAFTAAGHKVPTSTYNKAGSPFLPGGPGYGIHNTNDGRFTVIGGGLPVMVEGQVVGALGVSTGTPAQDEEVAAAGVAAFEEHVRGKGAKGARAKL